MLKVKYWKKLQNGIQFTKCLPINDVETVMRIADGQFFQWMDDVFYSLDFTTWAIDSFCDDGINVNVVNMSDNINQYGYVDVISMKIPINHLERIIIDSPSD